ncbi:MAG: DUF1934 domain-containing protein [Lachnospiraceae bacterium]|nr:DUF1934 domain-containing protein [Lachnospiraceae bacterium]
MIQVKDVRVKFHSAQESFNQKEEQRKLLQGKLYESHGAICLQFRDDEMNEEIVTHIEVKNNNEVVVRRTGIITSEMRFKKDETHKSSHKTGFGCVRFEMATKELDIDADIESVDIHIVYDLISAGGLVSTNYVDIVAK